jgi:two-component system, OmpR family, copper resistance phosphate regulon response regulator CusR
LGPLPWGEATTTARTQKTATGDDGASEKLQVQQGRSILIAEDDVSLASFLRQELQAASFLADLAYNGKEALDRLKGQARYDLLILDLNLPELDGMGVLHELRPAQPRMRTIVLTARNRVEDKVLALQSGADDYLVKPFSPMELLARVRALLRRDSGSIPNCSQVRDLILYREERRVERNGRRIDLTPREFAMLEYLMRNAGKPVSRATLYEEVWNAPFDPSTNIVDVYMKYVRDKVDLPGEPKLTHTIRGVGYELREA